MGRTRKGAGLGGLLVGMSLAAAGAWGQAPPAEPTCEAQVQAQYTQLSTEGLVIQGTAPQWGPQLTALATQIRTMRHQYEIKRNQADLAEQNIAQLLEQLRQARQQVQGLSAEVESLKNPK